MNRIAVFLRYTIIKATLKLCQIKDIENGLQSGSSALIAYVESKWVDRAVNRLQEAGALVVVTEQLVTPLIDPDMPARPSREM